MVNYENSTIYKIVCKDLDITDCYVGSTTNFNRRKSEHKTRYNNVNDKHYNLKVYKFIRDHGNFDNFDIIEVERYCAIDKNDLHARERYWLKKLKSNLNCQIPNRSSKEYNKTDKQIKYIKKQNEKLKLDKVQCNFCNKEMRKDSLNRHNKNIHNIH